MKSRMRVSGVFLIGILLLNMTGCRIPASAEMNAPSPLAPTATPAPELTATPVPAPAPTPVPVSPDVEWRPVAEEELADISLDAWLNIQSSHYLRNLKDMRAEVIASLPVVSPEVADAMVWRYICALRQCIDIEIKPMVQDKYVDLSYAYRDDGTLDTDALSGPVRDVLGEAEGTEIGWVDGITGPVPRIMYGRISEWIQPCSNTLRDLVALLARDDVPPVYRGELKISYRELADRTIAWEALLCRSMDTIFLFKVEDQYLEYLYLLLCGANDPSVFDRQSYLDNKILSISEEAVTAFKYILDTAPGSVTAVAVADWWQHLCDFVDSGASYSDAYEQLWEGFPKRVRQYAAASGVRFPRITLGIQTEVRDSDVFLSEMQYPVLYAEGVDAEVMEQVGNWITAEIRAHMTYTNTWAEYDHLIWPMWPYEAKSTLRLSRPAGSVVSIVVDLYSYTGGAHGGNYRCGYNFYPVTGRKMVLADLFKPEVNAWELIGEEVTRHILLNQERYESTRSGIPYSFFDGFPDETEWYTNDEGIVVIFQEYEVECYAAGTQEITVPWHRLSEYLK